MDILVVFWILFGLLGFAFALAVQMRVMIALVLRRALKAWNPELEDQRFANVAVMAAASGARLRDEAEPVQRDAAAHLVENYPNPLGHLRLARRASVAAPVLLLVLIIMARFGGIV